MRKIIFILAIAGSISATTMAATAAEGGKAAAPGKATQADPARLVSLLMTQIARCWNPPVGVLDSNLVVTVRFALNKDGTLSGEPAVINSGDGGPLFKAAAASASRAVLACQPLQLPAAQYDIWKDVEIRFDPHMAASRSPH
jgi:hypothetical protein